MEKRSAAQNHFANHALPTKENSQCATLSPQKENSLLKMLDVFCGLGGVSDGFAAEGYQVLGIDIEDMPKKGYRHSFLRSDILNLNGEDFRGYDVIWGSPPCRDFTRLCDHAVHKNGKVYKWKTPKNPGAGLVNVNAFLRFIEAAKPKFWILENVYGLEPYLDLKPRAYKAPIKGGKKHVFYGNYPSLLLPQTEATPTMQVQGKDRNWVRAKIPLACSCAFARACKEALLCKA